jgi:AcrR family transcriptional regulator
VEGISGLSLSRLADAVGMSKSGLFAHFGSKEELQLATIETANSIFDDLVLQPAAETEGGLERLRALLDGYLRYVESGVFPGGCFFASVAAEIDTHPGPVQDRALALVAEWFGQLETAVGQAQVEGSVKSDEDPTQIAFELDAHLLLANAQYVASGDPTTLDRARQAIERLLKSIAPSE